MTEHATLDALTEGLRARAPLQVAEIFGPTIQGEGPTAGRPAMFLRLMGCNLSCGWCDTGYTWDASRYDLHAIGQSRPVGDILGELLAHRAVRKVVITGGEPLLHQTRPGWDMLIEALAVAGMDIEIETNGTVTPTEETAEVARFNVSVKLAHAGLPRRARINDEALHVLRYGDSVFKFVVRTVDDLAEIDALLSAKNKGAIGPLDPSRIWVMPEGTTLDVVLATARDVVEETLARGWNLTLRQHVLIWPDEPRGR